jgi:hypothetical protein
MSMVLAQVSLVYLFCVQVLICAKSKAAKIISFWTEKNLPKLAKQNQYTAQQVYGWVKDPH